jgi:outer membrane protein assembly factor BamB
MADGTVVTFGAGITALDGTTGNVHWQLATDACIVDAALASDGSIVALNCDGTLFGASD